MPKYPFLVAAIGTKSKFWYSSDTTIFHGDKLENIISYFALQHFTKETSHLVDNSLSCIDLIFSSQQNLISDNCHHQTVYAKFNLQFYYLSQYH